MKTNRSNLLHVRSAVLILTLFLSEMLFSVPALADENALAKEKTNVATGQPDSESRTKPYSDAVVGKAEKIFADHNLRQTGKSIQSTKVSDVSRAMSGLSRRKRELKMIRDDWNAADAAVKMNRQQTSLLNRQNGELNLQLARVANTEMNNRLVGMINANIAKQQMFREHLDKLKEAAATKRSEMSTAEAGYAESVLAIREDLTAIRDQITLSLADKKVQTAISVVHANFGVPIEQSAGLILKSVERRLGKIEQEIFSESIPLRVENRSLYVDVVVGGKSMAMVIDSGASMVTLPAKMATQLSVSVPSDAPKIRLVMADGRSIMGHRVTLPSVRIGNFEAENIDAAVLSETADSAEPLLGMSFLGNFKFEIDAASKTLKMLRIDTD